MWLVPARREKNKIWEGVLRSVSEKEVERKIVGWFFFGFSSNGIMEIKRGEWILRPLLLLLPFFFLLAHSLFLI